MFPILLALLERPHRTSELRRAIPHASKKMLIDTLRRLEDVGVVSRTDMSKKRKHVRYAITEHLRMPHDNCSDRLERGTTYWTLKNRVPIQRYGSWPATTQLTALKSVCVKDGPEGRFCRSLPNTDLSSIICVFEASMACKGHRFDPDQVHQNTFQ